MDIILVCAALCWMLFVMGIISFVFYGQGWFWSVKIEDGCVSDDYAYTRGVLMSFPFMFCNAVLGFYIMKDTIPWWAAAIAAIPLLCQLCLCNKRWKAVAARTGYKRIYLILVNIALYVLCVTSRFLLHKAGY